MCYDDEIDATDTVEMTDRGWQEQHVDDLRECVDEFKLI